MIEPLTLSQLLLLMDIYRGSERQHCSPNTLHEDMDALVSRDLITDPMTDGLRGAWEPTDNGRRLVEACRALTTVDWVG